MIFNKYLKNWEALGVQLAEGGTELVNLKTGRDDLSMQVKMRGLSFQCVTAVAGWMG